MRHRNLGLACGLVIAWHALQVERVSAAVEQPSAETVRLAADGGSAPRRIGAAIMVRDAELWRRLIADGGPKLPDIERVVAVDAAGLVVARSEGTAGAATIPAAWGPRLLDPRDPVTLTHNHPGGNGLSADDLTQLAKPGVTGIIAIGHDGSVYAAARGDRYDWRALEPAAYDSVRRTVLNLLHASGVAHDVIGDHLNHLVALALARAGLLDYAAALGPRRRASWHGRVLLEPVVDRAVRSLKTERSARPR